MDSESNQLRICSREDQADVTHAISPISLKPLQMIKVIKVIQEPKVDWAPGQSLGY